MISISIYTSWLQIPQSQPKCSLRAPDFFCHICFVVLCDAFICIFLLHGKWLHSSAARGLQITGLHFSEPTTKKTVNLWRLILEFLCQFSAYGNVLHHGRKHAVGGMGWGVKVVIHPLFFEEQTHIWAEAASLGPSSGFHHFPIVLWRLSLAYGPLVAF